MSDKPEEYDVIISGGGLAGATLARLLPQLLGERCSVLLLESRTLGNQEQGGREKCCAGLISPAAQTWLKTWKLPLPEHILEPYQPQTVRTLDLESEQERSYTRHYINIKRLAFERWLLALLPQNVTFREGWRLHSFSCIQQSGGVSVEIATAQGRRTVRGRVLVGADGAFSLTRRLLGLAPPQERLYLAVQDSYALPEKGADILTRQHLAVFDSRITDFYGWGVPKSNVYLLGLALPLSQRTENTRLMERFTEALCAKGLPLGQRLQRQGTHILRPGFQELCLGQGPVFLLGEAAGWISPSSAEGFSYAFASANALAQSLAESWGKPDMLKQTRKNYFQHTLPLRASIAWSMAKSLVMYTPQLRRAALRLKLG